MGNTSYFIVLIVLMAFMVLSTIRATKQQKKQQQQMVDFQNSLKKGTEVVLNNGIYGTVESLSDTTAKVRIDENTVIKVDRYQIQRLAQSANAATNQAATETAEETENKSDDHNAE